MLLRNNDYRSTANSAFAPDISEKKNNLDAIIRSKHTKAKIMYNIVRIGAKNIFWNLPVYIMKNALIVDYQSVFSP